MRSCIKRRRVRSEEQKEKERQEGQKEKRHSGRRKETMSQVLLDLRYSCAIVKEHSEDFYMASTPVRARSHSH